MRYHIVKQGDTIDSILNKYGITYQNYINLNNTAIGRKLNVGEKIKLGELRLHSDTLSGSINRMYEKSISNDDDAQKYICPHCKNIICIPK